MPDTHTQVGEGSDGRSRQDREADETAPPARPEWQQMLSAQVEADVFKRSRERTAAEGGQAAPPAPLDRAQPAPEVMPEPALPTQDEDDDPQGPPEARADADVLDEDDALGRGDEHTTRISVYLPAALFAQVREVRNAQHTTYTDLILDEIDRRWDELDEHFPKPDGRQSPLPRRRPQRRQNVPTPVTMQLMLHDEEIAIIDGRRRELSLATRSEFITKIAELAVDSHASVSAT